jgi:hypothetical protein
MTKNHKMIIVEGMDNTGKTTLIQRLIRETGRGYLSAMVSLGPSKTILEQFHWVDKQIALAKMGGPLTVYDRFLPICDVIYGPIVRNGSLWGINHLIIDQLLKEVNPLIIYCRPSDSKVLGFEDGREQMEGVVENGQKLLDKYDVVIAKLKEIGFEVIPYDLEMNDLQNKNDKTYKYSFDYVAQHVRNVIRNYYINL